MYGWRRSRIFIHVGNQLALMSSMAIRVKMQSRFCISLIALFGQESLYKRSITYFRRVIAFLFISIISNTRIFIQSEVTSSPLKPIGLRGSMVEVLLSGKRLEKK